MTIFIIISVISCFLACGGSQDVKLQAVENLLDNNNTDSASLVLNEINYSDRMVPVKRTSSPCCVSDSTARKAESLNRIPSFGSA
jgi:hypothetical protein